MMDNAENADKKLETRLKVMNKADLLKFAFDEFGLTIDPAVINRVIVQEILDAAENAEKQESQETDTIALTEAQIKEIQAKAVADYKVEQTMKKPVPVDISENVKLKTRLKLMNKDQLIQFGKDEFSLKIEPVLTEKVIIDNLMRLDDARRDSAIKENEDSLNKSISASDPPIRVKFHNLMSPEEVITFSYAGPKGMRGPVNKTGHKKCPSYKLYPGEEYTLPLSVKEHLESLTFTHYKTIVDKLTGQIAGNVPILKPKYIMYPVISREQLLALQPKT